MNKLYVGLPLQMDKIRAGQRKNISTYTNQIVSKYTHKEIALMRILRFYSGIVKYSYKSKMYTYRTELKERPCIVRLSFERISKNFLQ